MAHALQTPINQHTDKTPTHQPATSTHKGQLGQAFCSFAGECDGFSTLKYCSDVSGLAWYMLGAVDDAPGRTAAQRREQAHKEAVETSRALIDEADSSCMRNEGSDGKTQQLRLRRHGERKTRVCAVDSMEAECGKTDDGSKTPRSLAAPHWCLCVVPSVLRENHEVDQAPNQPTERMNEQIHHHTNTRFCDTKHKVEDNTRKAHNTPTVFGSDHSPRVVLGTSQVRTLRLTRLWKSLRRSFPTAPLVLDLLSKSFEQPCTVDLHRFSV